MQHRARKRFGQNFLSDQRIIDAIVSAINPKPEQTVIEIGPGLGAMTFPLLRQAKRMTAIELDRDLFAHLQQKSPEYGELTVINADVLTVDFNQFGSEQRIVGNLPYNISTPILMHLLQNIEQISDMTFMLQKEVVDRMAAEPNTKAYGRLSVILQYLCEVRPVLEVPPAAFTPAPKVTSAVVCLSPHKVRPYEDVPLSALTEVVKAAFAMRRKTLRNNLKGLVDEASLLSLGIEPSRRAEALTVEEFVKLASCFKNNAAN